MTIGSFPKYFRNRIKDRGFSSVIIIYISFCIFSAVYFFIKGKTRDFLLSLGFILFVAAIFAVEYMFSFRMGNLFICASLFIAVGSILGSGYNFYTIFPFHDSLLHGMSGFLFAVLGAAFGERLFRGREEKAPFYAVLLFALCFSLAISCIWEIFEFACTVTMGYDMMEDTVITDISSYFLSGTHSEPVVINGIAKTVIYYGDGATYIIDGYLEIGLFDTLGDMIICLIGAVLFLLISVFSHKKLPLINELLIPKLINH